ncbi:unnamed protein product [Bursaphelenchus xylophilus]|uniref:(pine wood nematode) hypothetical protein n=1 Tax=Bursaphelenchus xylophilus TaxID=6326 RepID=A0A811LEN3_BURXY|nr:unnamed protein product [Bursaphelenchus xylophilus]CAG9116517.1 unnamed protein product [Bursaphelenchus xylophilus]
MPREQRFTARDIPVNSVTVFSDRAELRRSFDVALMEGLNTVVIENVSPFIDGDSIRVDGQGSATIQEVNFVTEPSTDAENDSPQIKEWTRRLNELLNKKAVVDEDIKVNSKKIKSLDDIAENLGKLTFTTGTMTVDDVIEHNLERFFTYYGKKSTEINAKLRNITVEYRELQENISKIQRQIEAQRSGEKVKRCIYILLDTYMKETSAEVNLTYQVTNAFWTPSFDIRVNTTISNGVKLYYFGNVHQKCGEDWNQVDLMLSTAQPNYGGQLPHLGTLNVQFPQGTVEFADPNVRIVTRKADGSIGAPKVESHVLSTTFRIPEKKIIKSDGSDHKITIVALDLEPVLHFDCVPRKNLNVFLTASIINTSTYPLLSGLASIYVDNNFSAKVQLPSIYSGERFDCSLGVDPSIKVFYKPITKYQQRSGMLNNYTVAIYEQKVVVKNSKTDESVVVTLIDHLPKTTDEKLQIKLYTPDLKPTQQFTGIGTNDDLKPLKAPELGAKLNENHNVEWTVLLNPMEEKEYVIKYGVEIPPGELVEYAEEQFH